MPTAKAKKTWVEKLRCEMQPEVKPLNKAFSGFKVGDRLLIPTPLMVDAYVRSIPMGQTRTIKQMREDLAKTNEADVTCPLCAGIFSRIVSEAANEELQAGKALNEVSPFWRILEPKGSLRKKISFDLSLADDLLASEAAKV
jgi:hypothetical protein